MFCGIPFESIFHPYRRTETFIRVAAAAVIDTTASSQGGKLPYLELNRSSLPHVFCLIDMYVEELNDASKGLQIEKLLHRLRVSNPRLNEKHK